ncbi:MULTISPECIES: DUF190 domain-containing protein [unclassified Modicisalibacter]|uniref:DUF190 domain-containing protein n=1 Tax=unclassified Modicisalibacter TaxID=2679913 RepID=UPI001CCA7E85|nr:MULTISPECIES: DUF190 domain-containing protein [unclassified Modicisalibacter]MBZ9560420.1 DUF190 domain-containing protein [Modicisalibacter sp. R2A 31.J]MBZ9576329.1 DUF190 domain-containing protein [Modicisalibacter sp. MOD 31.J]
MTSLDSGYELLFMAPESRRHAGEPVLDAVVEAARTLGITRYTRRADVMSAGENGHVHAAHFFELADRPSEVMFVLEPTLAERLIEAVDTAGIDVFCLRRPVEYGHLGD